MVILKQPLLVGIIVNVIFGVLSVLSIIFMVPNNAGKEQMEATQNSKVGKLVNGMNSCVTIRMKVDGK